MFTGNHGRMPMPGLLTNPILISAAIEKLSGYKRIAVWVLEGNHRAIKFYERCGFRFDGTKEQIMLGTVNTEIRMVLTKDVAL